MKYRTRKMSKSTRRKKWRRRNRRKQTMKSGDNIGGADVYCKVTGAVPSVGTLPCQRQVVKLRT